MIEIDIDKVYQKLVNDYNVLEKEHWIMKNLAEKVKLFPKELKKCVSIWLDTDEMTDFKVKEFSALYYVENHNFNYINALNSMAWLLQDYETASKRLKHGWDSVGGSR